MGYGLYSTSSPPPPIRSIWAARDLRLERTQQKIRSEAIAIRATTPPPAAPPMTAGLRLLGWLGPAPVLVKLQELELVLLREDEEG
jgi:hypothetical protein